MRSREDLRGIAGTNIDYASTVQMMPAKKNQKKEVRTAEPAQDQSVDEPGGQENQDSFQLNPKQRGCMRAILGGVVQQKEDCSKQA